MRYLKLELIQDIHKMIYGLKAIIDRNKALVQNFSYLTILQFLSLLLPLMVYPYLIKVLGAEIYGLIVFAQAVVGYFVVLINFGFNITGTKEISIHRNNSHKINEIVSSIFIIKCILFIISFLIISLFVNVIPELRNYRILIYLTMWMCFNEVVFPIWYFQGIEKMKYITLFSLISKLIFLALVLFFVNSKEDYLRVPIFYGMGTLVLGIFSFAILIKNKIKFELQDSRVLLKYVKSSYVMALAYSSNVFKLNFNLIIVKFFFSFSEVAYFDLAFKIINIFSSFIEIINQAIFPKMSREKNIKFLKKVILLSFLLSIFLVVFIQIFAGKIVFFLGGYEMQPTEILLKILALYLPFYIVGALLGRNGLIVFGYDKNVLISMVYSLFVYVSLIFIVYFFTENITAISLILIFISSFAFETFYRFRICKVKNIF